MKKYFFCGIGGSGMEPLAFVLKAKGCEISGSDRAFDAGTSPDKFAKIAAQGITLFPQDGSGLTEDTTALVISGAVEESVPDVVAARALNLPVITRAELLAEFFGLHNGIAVGGTSGKTTTTDCAANGGICDTTACVYPLCSANMAPQCTAANEIVACQVHDGGEVYGISKQSVTCAPNGKCQACKDGKIVDVNGI